MMQKNMAGVCIATTEKSPHGPEQRVGGRLRCLTQKVETGLARERKKKNRHADISQKEKRTNDRRMIQKDKDAGRPRFREDLRG
jgi:hypothetical protein